MKNRLLTLFLLCPVLSLHAGEILFLLEKGFNRQEFYDLYLPLKALGYDIDIASTEKGAVFLRKEGTPDKRGRDVLANTAMRDVKDTSGYRSLVIPGGYSPGFLENDPDAQRIVQAFAANPKQVTAAICHGPRVLMAAGSLDGKVWTGLHNIASEKPDTWIEQGHGTYVDQQVVKDGNLMTSRYPQDTPVLGRRLAEELERRGGRSLPKKAGTYVLMTPKGFDGHVRWSYMSPLKTLGFNIIAVDSLEKVVEKGVESIQGVIRFQQGGEIETSHPVLGQFATTMVTVPNGEFAYPELLPSLTQFCERSGIEKEAVEPPSYDVAIILAEGADEKVVLSMQTYFEAQGQRVVLTGLEPGWLKGLGGFPLHVDVPVQELKDLKAVVAPGGLWPEKKDDARQGETAEWIGEQAKKDEARQAWILAQLEGGSELILVGLDALRLGRQPRFKGSKFSSTRQAQWSFGKAGGKFSTEPFTHSTDKIWSISGYAALPAWIRAQHLSE